MSHPPYLPATGWLPDPLDARDVPLVAIGALPSHASVADARVQSKDQGRTSSCVGQAWAQAVRLAYLHAGIAAPELSARWIYKLARQRDGTATADVGTYLRSAAKAVMACGVASEEACPFAGGAINSEMPYSSVHDAFDRRGLRAYYRIPSGDVDSIRRAIAGGLPVVAGWRIDATFPAWDGRAPIGRQGTEIGGHAMCIELYDGDEWDLLNSWGTGWGRHGRARVTSDFIAQAGDVWAVDVRSA